jgi:transcriptional regulator with PAS, ATPase and Fis domain
MPYLIMNKNNTGYRVAGFSTSITIGRDSANDIVLRAPSDREISRYHANISRLNDDYILQDTSTNGTFVSGKRIEKYVLFDGARFRIMDYSFTFVLESAQGETGKKTNDFPKDKSFNGEQTAVITPPEDILQQRNNLKHRLRNAGIIAENETMISLYMDVDEIAKINVPVLILGEPGTGKENVAQAIHDLSNGAGDFVPLNCSSIPEGLFESELFGSVRGAFHNATDKPGKLELASDGTIFLDEIGDMGLSLQPKLLRFLEDKTITRLGDTQTRRIDVRVIAATNQDLKAMMEEKTFREDLYQRLACIRLEVPPLRERREDILPLTKFFLSRFVEEHKLRAQKLSNEAKEMLVAYRWPGNVRELSNVLLNAAIRSRGRIIEPAHLSAALEEIAAGGTPSTDAFTSLEDMEKLHIKEALARTGGNKTRASKFLGISRDTLYKKLRKYKML